MWSHRICYPKYWEHMVLSNLSLPITISKIKWLFLFNVCQFWIGFNFDSHFFFDGQVRIRRARKFPDNFPLLGNDIVSKEIEKLLFELFFFFPFRAAPHGIWRLPGKGPIRATAAGLRHSNTGSETHLQQTLYSSWQCQILNPLSEARDWTCNLMVPSLICFRCTTMETPRACCLNELVFRLLKTLFTSL